MALVIRRGVAGAGARPAPSLAAGVRRPAGRRAFTARCAPPLQHEAAAAPPTCCFACAAPRTTRRGAATDAATRRPAPCSAAAGEAPRLPYRVGHGFDLHRLAEGYKLIVGGVDIPHTKGCEAHSDGAQPGALLLLPPRRRCMRCRLRTAARPPVCSAPPSAPLTPRPSAGDVLLHTITDALLGALCLPDIGRPPTLLRRCLPRCCMPAAIAGRGRGPGAPEAGCTRAAAARSAPLIVCSAPTAGCCLITAPPQASSSRTPTPSGRARGPTSFSRRRCAAPGLAWPGLACPPPALRLPLAAEAAAAAGPTWPTQPPALSRGEPAVLPGGTPGQPGWRPGAALRAPPPPPLPLPLPCLTTPPCSLSVPQVRLMEDKGYVMGNIDCTIIAQKPKMSPHKVRGGASALPPPQGLAALPPGCPLARQRTLRRGPWLGGCSSTPPSTPPPPHPWPWPPAGRHPQQPGHPAQGPPIGHQHQGGPGPLLLLRADAGSCFCHSCCWVARGQSAWRSLAAQGHDSLPAAPDHAPPLPPPPCRPRPTRRWTASARSAALPATLWSCSSGKTWREARLCETASFGCSLTDVPDECELDHEWMMAVDDGCVTGRMEHGELNETRVENCI
jgi:2C-methyl-D-erythritol 2,4-cyclodiphosphate synthase